MKAILTSGETIQVDHKGPGKWYVTTPDGKVYRLGISGTSDTSDPEVWVGTETASPLGTKITPVYDHGVRALILQGGMLTIIPKPPAPKAEPHVDEPKPWRFVPYCGYKEKTGDA